jgi:hypothetical protein
VAQRLRKFKSNKRTSLRQTCLLDNSLKGGFGRTRISTFTFIEGDVSDRDVFLEIRKVSN